VYGTGIRAGTDNGGAHTQGEKEAQIHQGGAGAGGQTVGGIGRGEDQVGDLLEDSRVLVGWNLGRLGRERGEREKGVWGGRGASEGKRRKLKAEEEESKLVNKHFCVREAYAAP
jgi:hypothetical protein